MTEICPVSVLIPTKNEERNIGKCLQAVTGWADEVVIVDSQSEDATIMIATEYGAQVAQFHYKGGWPKKRQWALDNHNWKNDWILLLDADEILLTHVKQEIQEAILNDRYDGYWLRFRIVFLGKMLRYGGTSLWKLSLFRLGKGRYEKRLEDQDASMADMEVHEHVVVDGKTSRLRNSIRHENTNMLDRYIHKHNEYSNWEAKVFYTGGGGEITPKLFGNQAQRRRFLRQQIFVLPGTAFAYFLLKYILQLGFLDGRPGFYYCAFQAIQLFHIKAKIYEINLVGSGPKVK